MAKTKTKIIYAAMRPNKIKGRGDEWQCTCGQWHELTGYVYAHYREVLVATCDKCGTKHETQLGKVWRNK